MPRTQREDSEFQAGLAAWTIRERRGLRQRKQASNIPPAIDEQAHYEQMHMDSLLYDEMERGER